jgi:D-amino-acid dehydrogenase
MLSLFDEESKIVTSGLGNHKFRVAGIAGIAWHNLNLVDARIKLLIKFTEYHFSKVSIKYVKLWVGLN